MEPSIAGVLAHAFIVGSVMASPYAKLEKCYNNNQGEVEETTSGDTSTERYRYKEPEQLNAECNAKVIKAARQEKNQAKLKELAGIIGKNSNWGATIPVYALAAKVDPKKRICADKDVADALNVGLARSEDDAKDSFALMKTCWPKIKPSLLSLLTPDQNGYTKQNICKFLNGHGGIPDDKKSLCTEN